MTAGSTPRLGLMAPVDSDLFVASDFSSTFNKLDSVPGTTIVNNYAGLTALTWTSAQYGSKVLQLDNGAEWYWASPGVWKRSNSIGIISQVVQDTPLVTTSTSHQDFIDTGNLTFPGGRPVMCQLNAGVDNTSGLSAGFVILTMYDNGVMVRDDNFRIGNQVNANGQTVQVYYYLTNPAPQSTHRIVASIRSGSTPVSVGGMGTSAARRSILTVSEM